MPLPGRLRRANVPQLKVVEELVEDVGLIRIPVAFRLLPQQEQQIDCFGGGRDAWVYFAGLANLALVAHAALRYRRATVVT